VKKEYNGICVEPRRWKWYVPLNAAMYQTKNNVAFWMTTIYFTVLPREHEVKQL
jgi:hypothetical protein